VLVVLALVGLALLVGLLSWKMPQRIQVRSCCSARQWPPDDLTGAGSERRS
jgi:hypothetical protein